MFPPLWSIFNWILVLVLLGLCSIFAVTCIWWNDIVTLLNSLSKIPSIYSHFLWYTDSKNIRFISERWLEILPSEWFFSANNRKELGLFTIMSQQLILVVFKNCVIMLLMTWIGHVYWQCCGLKLPKRWLFEEIICLLVLNLILNKDYFNLLCFIVKPLPPKSLIFILFFGEFLW